MGWIDDADNTPFTLAVKPMPALHGVAQAGRPIGCDASDEETPAVGGGRGWVLETGCRRVSRRFDPARRWLAIGKDDLRHAPVTIRRATGLADPRPGMPGMRVRVAERPDLRAINSLSD